MLSAWDGSTWSSSAPASPASLRHTRHARPASREAADTAAGWWPRSYDSLTLFSPARYSALPGRPLSGDPDRYPARDEVLACLQGYSSQFGDAIRLGERVETITRSGGDGFTIATSSGGELSAGAVIAASGSFGRPHRRRSPPARR